MKKYEVSKRTLFLIHSILVFFTFVPLFYSPLFDYAARTYIQNLFDDSKKGYLATIPNGPVFDLRIFDDDLMDQSWNSDFMKKVDYVTVLKSNPNEKIPLDQKVMSYVLMQQEYKSQINPHMIRKHNQTFISVSEMSLNPFITNHLLSEHLNFNYIVYSSPYLCQKNTKEGAGFNQALLTQLRQLSIERKTKLKLFSLQLIKFNPPPKPKLKIMPPVRLPQIRKKLSESNLPIELFDLSNHFLDYTEVLLNFLQYHYNILQSELQYDLKVKYYQLIRILLERQLNQETNCFENWKRDIKENGGWFENFSFDFDIGNGWFGLKGIAFELKMI